MGKDVREFIRRLEVVGLTLESRPGHYHVLRDGKPLPTQNGMPVTVPFSPDTIRWRRTASVDLRKLRHAARPSPNTSFLAERHLPGELALPHCRVGRRYRL